MFYFINEAKAVYAAISGLINGNDLEDLFLEKSIKFFLAGGGKINIPMEFL